MLVFGLGPLVVDFRNGIVVACVVVVVAGVEIELI